MVFGKYTNSENCLNIIVSMPIKQQLKYNFKKVQVEIAIFNIISYLTYKCIPIFNKIQKMNVKYSSLF